MQKKYYIALLFVMISGGLYSINLSEYVIVLSMYLKNPSQMGEIAPFSQFVGNELTKYIEKNSKSHLGDSKFYLEAGGGCGAVSVCIVKKMKPSDHLDIIEINPDLCKVLRKKFSENKNISVHCCSILDWSPSYKYDAVVCTLPFLSLGVDFTKQTMNHFKEVSNVQAIISYVDYPLIKMLRNLVYGLRLKPYDFIAVQRYMDILRDNYLLESKTIYRNVPSTNVYHLCFCR